MVALMSKLLLLGLLIFYFIKVLFPKRKEGAVGKKKRERIRTDGLSVKDADFTEFKGE